MEDNMSSVAQFTNMEGASVWEDPRTATIH